MALDGAGSSKNSSRAANRNPTHRKRPWTASEDMILLRYVEEHGEQNWNSIQLNFGLNRSGKSCRHRWANHLNPTVRKNPFSLDEVRRIFEMHDQIGGKWSLIAAELPGRTDNDIKNFWNIRYRRHLRTGLPMNPCQSHQGDGLPMNPRRRHQDDGLPMNPRRRHQDDVPPISSSPQFLFQHSNADPSCLSNVLPSPLPNNTSKNLIDNSPLNDQLKICHGSNGDWALSLMPSHTSFSSPSSSNPALQNSLPMISTPENSLYFGLNLSPVLMVSEPPSALPLEAETAALASFSSDLSSMGTHEYKKDTLITKGRLAGQSTMDFGAVRNGGFHGRGTSVIDNIRNMTPAERNEFLGDELLSSLLNSFPLTVPIPEWEDCHPCAASDFMKAACKEPENGSSISAFNQAGTSSEAPNQDHSFGPCIWSKPF